MPQKLLNVANVYPILKQVGGKGMAQGVEGGRLGDTHFNNKPKAWICQPRSSEVRRGPPPTNRLSEMDSRPGRWAAR